MKIPSLLQIPCGTEASYNNRITTKYKKTGKEHKEHIQLTAAFHSSYQSNKIVWVWLQMVKHQNTKCCMKIDLFFFRYLCVFTFSLIFIYFVAQ